MFFEIIAFDFLLNLYWKKENLWPARKKPQKCEYLTAGLRKIIRPKKKMQNSVSCYFYIHVKAKKQPPTQNLKKQQIRPKNFYKTLQG